MAEPITLPIETDPADLEALAFDYLESAIPGWNRARGDVMTQHIGALALIIAEARDTASDVPLAIMRYLGRWVDGIPPVDATSAQTTATVTALDTLGYTIADGTRFLIMTSGDEGEVFASVGDVTIPAGSLTTATGEVVLVAETPGADGSGLPAASTVTPLDSLAWVDTVTLEALTTGGVDAETDDEYLARLIEVRQLATDTPILATDFARQAVVLFAEVGRALGLDNYNPADGTSTNEKMVAIFLADPDGEPVSAGVKADVDAMLQGKREIGFIVHVGDATYTTIDVTFDVVAYPNYDTAGVNAAVVSALQSYLDPATWGTPRDADETLWFNEGTVRYLELAEVVNRVEGVHYVSSLTFRVAAGAFATTDVVLTGPAPLTRPGTISGSVVTP